MTADRGPARRGGTGVNLALAGATVIAMILLAEGGFRVFGLGPPRHAPEATGDEPAEERVNSLGFRGPEWVEEKPPSRYRILFVGDSFTRGRGVAEEEIFVSVAGARLARGGRDVEVLNLSRPGWDTRDEIRALEETGLRYEPDTVVLVFFLNDATHLDSNPVIAWRLHRELNRRDGFLNRVSRLWDTVDYIRIRRRVTAETTRDYRSSYLGTPSQTALWDEGRRALGRGKRICEERGVPLAVVVFPMLIGLDDYPFADVHEAVTSACGDLGIPTLDLLPVFEGEDGPSLWVTPRNAHPNARAHRIAGEAIADFIERVIPAGP